MTQTMKPPITVKLCGLRGTDDARAAVLSGADLVGIVLVPGARRYVPPPTARAMVRIIRETAMQMGRFAPEIVGVVGQMSLAVAKQLVDNIGIDCIQLVGSDSECKPIAHAVGDIPKIRSIAVSNNDKFEDIRECTIAWEKYGARIIYDAAIEGELGGTGHLINPDIVRPLLALGRYGLAGGLDPENVAQIIRDSRPYMVDVSSGIESHAGHKDADLMQAFVSAAKAANIDSQSAETLQSLKNTDST